MEITADMFISGGLTFAAAIGFGVCFNIRGANLFAASFGAFICAFIEAVMTEAGFSEVFVCFIASTAVTVYSEILAKRLRCPVPMFLIISIIPLVPGSYIYYAMMSCINGDIADFGKRSVYTFEIAGAIALGIFLVTFAIKLMKSFKKIPVKKNR